MNIEDIRKLTTEELKDKITESKVELAEIEFDLRMGRETDHASRRILRKSIARMKTVLNENLQKEVK